LATASASLRGETGEGAYERIFARDDAKVDAILPVSHEFHHSGGVLLGKALSNEDVEPVDRLRVQARAPRPFQRLPHRRSGHAEPPGDLVRRYGRKLQPNNLARIAHPNPLRWHRSSFGVAKGTT